MATRAALDGDRKPEARCGSSLDDPVTCLPGVTEPFAAALGKGLGIFTAGDLLAALSAPL